MTDQNINKNIQAGLKRRYRSEYRFRGYGLLAIGLALSFLIAIFVSIASMGWSAFQQTAIELEIYFDPAVIDPTGSHDPQDISGADYRGLVKASLRRQFPAVRNRREKKQLYRLVSSGSGFNLREKVQKDLGLIGQTRKIWVLASDDVDMHNKGRDVGARLSTYQIDIINKMSEAGIIKKRFNTRFFTSGDSREPELAGILAAFMGSLFSLTVCIALSFPLGILTAIYLEEFAPKNRWTDLIEVNINNLAAVPSIVFGLLGLFFLLNILEMPRSAPLVGGLVLALMTLPTIIIAGRAALKSVPGSIREAALGIGASPIQAVFHHSLPLAMPGMLTGSIIGMAQALGETAPLLMIGMVAFIVDVPQTVLDPATALPVQIFLWADSPERGFEEKTAAAILVLLGFLFCMNLLAVVLRKKFERRW
ncbi:MAG TPA: phosphate ABC transporter permease PstA [Rhodospirillales bacterium]|nr:phosphate ABC transporter permease PstA [Rhodospirillales bacterium]